MVRRHSVILLTARDGNRQAARKIMTATLRQVFGAGYRGDPWVVRYLAPDPILNRDQGQWELETSEGEWAALMAAIPVAYAAAGWTDIPLDCYRD